MFIVINKLSISVISNEHHPESSYYNVSIVSFLEIRR